jgi:hypothetical protein
MPRAAHQMGLSLSTCMADARAGSKTKTVNINIVHPLTRDTMPQIETLLESRKHEDWSHGFGWEGPIATETKS